MFFGYRTVYWLILFVACFFRLTLALDYVAFNEISSKIIDLNEMRKDGHYEKSERATDALLNQLRELKSESYEESDLLESLIKITKFDNNKYIKFNELSEVLSAMKKVQNNEPKQSLIFLGELLSGAKEIKNVLIAGRTRGGKSTFLSTLIDPFDKNLKDEISRDSLFSYTLKASHHWVIFTSFDKGLYVARLIDTPGFNEIKAIGNPMSARSDSEIIDDIAESIKGLKIHRVFQIFPLSGSFDRADLQAFDLLSKTLSERDIYHGLIDLVFPRADQTNGKTQRHLINELMTIFPSYAQAGEEAPRQKGKTFCSGTWFNYYFEDGYASSVMANAPRLLFLRNKIVRSIFGEAFLEFMEVDELNFVSLSPEASQRLEALIPNRKCEEYVDPFDWEL